MRAAGVRPERGRGEGEIIYIVRISKPVRMVPRRPSVDVVIASCEGRLRDERRYLFSARECGIDALRAAIDGSHVDPRTVRVFVYEKCGRAVTSAHGSPIATFLPNVGREQHTYLHHVVDRYDDLANYTLFTPDDLCGAERNNSGGPPRRRQFIHDLLALARPSLPSAGVACIGTPFALCHGCSKGRKSPPPLQVERSFAIERHQGRPLTLAEPRPLYAWSTHHLGGFDGARPTCWAGTFMASRAALRARPREGYATLRHLVTHAEPEAIHYLERLAAVVYDAPPVSRPLVWAGSQGFAFENFRSLFGSFWSVAVVRAAVGRDV